MITQDIKYEINILPDGQMRINIDKRITEKYPFEDEIGAEIEKVIKLKLEKERKLLCKKMSDK